MRRTSVRVTHPCTNRTQHCLTSVSQRNYHNSMPHSQYSSIHKPVISIVRNFSLFCLYCLHLNIVSLNSFALKRPTVRQTSVVITHPFTNRAQRCVSFSEHLRACDSIYSYFNMFSLTYGASPAVYYYYYGVYPNCQNPDCRKHNRPELPKVNFGEV